MSEAKFRGMQRLTVKLYFLQKLAVRLSRATVDGIANQRMAMIQDSDARQVQPRFVMDETGISILQAMPLMAQVSSPAHGAAGPLSAHD